MYNVKSKKHGFTVRDGEDTPMQFTYPQAEREIAHQCEKWGMDPKEFEIVPAPAKETTNGQ